MKKVIYSITKLGKVESTKVTGLGYVTDEELITAGISKSSNKPYVRIYDCIKNCHPIANTEDEYRGTHYEIYEYEGRDIKVNYYIWYKIVK